MRIRPILLTLCLLSVASSGFASEWHSFRGPNDDGTSPETGLIARWSTEGENLLWRADLIGRSTPVVFDGRACANGRVGDEFTKQELVACFDAGTGARLWEYRFNAFQTTVPFSRVGWAEPAGDPETGNLYVHGVGGLLIAFDRKGKVLWERSMTEEFGRFSGYGGRTHSPVVDEDRVVLGATTVAWGDHARPVHRWYAFDKRTGEIVWVSTVAELAVSMTTCSTPVPALINGQRLLIAGNSDGAIYALKARTGEMVWKFKLSKLGLNTSVAVAGTRVFAATGDEPIDEAIMGRAVAFDGSGKGDITATAEIWRVPGLKAKFASPAVHDGVVYIIDDAANLYALDAENGTEVWTHQLGTVGRGSPAVADGKLFATDVNGGFHILRAGRDGGASLDDEHVTVADGRFAEIYGSPAIAYGRVYFSAESGLYALGNPGVPFSKDPGDRRVLDDGKPEKEAKPATLLVVPADVTMPQGGTVSFRALTFDNQGRRLGEVKGNWTAQGLAGEVTSKGKFTPEVRSGGQAGQVTVNAAGLQASARVRVVPSIPFTEDFESIAVGKNPRWFVAAGSRFMVEEREGGKVLAKPFADKGVERQTAFLGLPTATGYTIQADMMGTETKRRRPDMGLVAGRYTLDFQGGYERLVMSDWEELPRQASIDLAWEPNVWYTMKMRVDLEATRAVIRGKIWKRADPEPAEWTITAEDPVPNRSGSPGLYGNSPTTIYYDNVKVTESE